MKIRDIECRLVRLPTRRPHRWASLTAEVGSYVLVKVTTDEGFSGWGEATALAQWGGDYGRYYGETPGTVIHLIRDLLGPGLVGGDVSAHRSLYDEMDKAVRGHHYAKMALDAAILDIVAQAAQIPVYELLGGKRRHRIPMAHSLGLLPTDQVVREVGQALDEGVGTIKLKVGEDFKRDIDTVLRVRETIGEDVDLVVDANQAWRTVPEAQRMIFAMEPARLRYVEQPVAGVDAMARLATRVEVPLMADESMWTAHDMVEMVRCGAASLASIYTSKAGSLHKAMQSDAVAVATGIGTNVNGSGETGVGNLANVHLSCAMSSLTEACVFPVTGLRENRSTEIVGAMYTDDVLAEPLAFSDGCVVVPDGPGWGIAVDEEKVDHYTIERMRLSG